MDRSCYLYIDDTQVRTSCHTKNTERLCAGDLLKRSSGACRQSSWYTGDRGLIASILMWLFLQQVSKQPMPALVVLVCEMVIGPLRVLRLKTGRHSRQGNNPMPKSCLIPACEKQNHFLNVILDFPCPLIRLHFSPSSNPERAPQSYW